ncbi:Phosphoglycerate mutase [Methanococcus vannielii SB]|uniref:Phosphoglycerate mutase n=1 Tax=Methanococcus vannielii (strain ATCC 35089 / DSM 1224 / JCM 13029 / OCM 148 / SB) TaxID=406327 RepID=A6US92_METVS|nr:phosphoglycerate mutase [Methanococcus vannielii]ABR55364.1 Phosphoglycerate mutase [Methanococcus vannielii SB]
MKTIVLSLDGLLDDVYEELGNKTPLEYANTKNLDKILQNGSCGLMNSYMAGVPKISYEDTFVISGYPKELFPGMGVIKALGEDLEIKDNTIYMECFFVPVLKDEDGFRVINRVNNDILEDDLNKIRDCIPNYYEGYEFHLQKCKNSTCVISMSDKSGWISDKISDSDPYFQGRHVQKIVPVKELCSTEPEYRRAESTANALNKFLLRIHKLLDSNEVNEKRKRRGKYPINFMLTKFAGKQVELPSFQEKTGMKTISISDFSQAKGFSKLLKWDYLIVNDSKEVFQNSIKYLEYYDLIYAKTTYLKDSCLKYAPFEKVSEIEKLDSYLEPFTNLENVLIIITSNKVYPFLGTLVNSGDPYSIIVSGKNVRRDDTPTFNEKNCYKGNLRIKYDELLNIILNYTNKALLNGLRPGPNLIKYIPNDEDLEHLQ